MPESVSVERRSILRALGADIILTPGSKGTDGAIETAYEMAESTDRYFMPDQFNNPNNVLAHYETTGPEIWEQTDGKITHFIAGMGTTGTLMGVSTFLRERRPDMWVIGVEPFMGHKIQGLKNMEEAYKPGIFDMARIDEKINVHDEPAYEMARRLAKEEGILVGMSSGAVLHVAVQKVAELDAGVVVVLLADGGERYLSTNLFDLGAK
jgi:cysteinyl-tRNA synthetase